MAGLDDKPLRAPVACDGPPTVSVKRLSRRICGWIAAGALFAERSSRSWYRVTPDLHGEEVVACCRGSCGRGIGVPRSSALRLGAVQVGRHARRGPGGRWLAKQGASCMLDGSYANPTSTMHLQSILRRVQPLPGFIYGRVELRKTQPLGVDVHILRPRAGSRALCGNCGRKRPGYDTLDERQFAFVPLWGMAVFLLYAMRRVRVPSLRRDCRDGSMGVGQVAHHTRLRLVPGELGEGAVVDRDGATVPDELGRRLGRRHARRSLGPGASQPRRDPQHRRRRAGVEEGTQVPHARLPDRPRLPPTAAHRQGPDCQELRGLLRHARRRALQESRSSPATCGRRSARSCASAAGSCSTSSTGFTSCSS